MAFSCFWRSLEEYKESLVSGLHFKDCRNSLCGIQICFGLLPVIEGLFWFCSILVQPLLLGQPLLLERKQQVLRSTTCNAVQTKTYLGPAKPPDGLILRGSLESHMSFSKERSRLLNLAKSTVEWEIDYFLVPQKMPFTRPSRMTSLLGPLWFRT